MIRRLNHSRAHLAAGAVALVLGTLLVGAATSSHAATPKAAAMPLTKPRGLTRRRRPAAQSRKRS